MSHRPRTGGARGAEDRETADYPASAAAPASAPRPATAASASAAGTAGSRSASAAGSGVGLSSSFGGLASPIYPSYSDAPSMLSPGLSPHEFAQHSPEMHAQTWQHTQHQRHSEDDEEQKGPPPASPPSRRTAVSAAAADSDDDDDDEAMLASSMARSKAFFSRPLPPPREQIAASSNAVATPAPAAAASYAPSATAALVQRATLASSSAAAPSSSSLPLPSTSGRPLHASPPRRGSVSSVSSNDGDGEGMSPPRVRHSQTHYQPAQPQQTLRPHPPATDSPARHTLFPTPHPPSSPQPPRTAAAGGQRPAQIQQQQQQQHSHPDDEDLFRELPASSKPDALRTRISMLRERLQHTEGSRDAYAGHADALQHSLDDLTRVNETQYLQIKDLQQHIEFLTNLRTQPGNAASAATAPMDKDLSALRGRALENSHLQTVALQSRVTQLEAALAQQHRTVALLEAEQISRTRAGQSELERLRTEMNRLSVLSDSVAKSAARTLSATGQSVEQLQSHNDLLQEDNRRLQGELAERDEKLRQSELLLASTMEAFQTSERALAFVHEQLQAQSEDIDRLSAELAQARMDSEALDASDAEGLSVARMRAAHEKEMNRLREQYEDELNKCKQMLNQCEQQLNYFKAKQQTGAGSATTGALADPAQSIHNDSEADLLGGGSVTGTPARGGGGRNALSPQPSPLASAQRWQDYARPLAPEITVLQSQLSEALQQIVTLDSEAAQLREEHLRLQREKEEILAAAAKQVESVQKQARMEKPTAGTAVTFATPAGSPAGSPSRRFGSAAAGSAAGVDREYVESLLEQIAQLKQANERLLHIKGEEDEQGEAAGTQEEEPQARSRGSRGGSSAPARPISARKHGSVVPGDRAPGAAQAAFDPFDPDFLSDLVRFLPHLLTQFQTLFTRAHQADRWLRFYMRQSSSALDSTSAGSGTALSVSGGLNDSLASTDSSDPSAAATAVAADPFPLDAEELDLIASGTDEQAFAELLDQRAEDDRRQMESVVSQLEARAKANLTRGAPGLEELQEFVLKQLLRLSSRVSTLPPRLSAHRAHLQLVESERSSREAQLAERDRRLESESLRLQDQTRRFEMERSTVQTAMIDEEAEQRRQAEAILAGGAAHSGNVALTRANFASALPLSRRQSPFFLKEALLALDGACSNPQHADLLQHAIDLHEELRSERKDKSDAGELRTEMAEKQRVVDQLQEALESLKAQTAQQLASQAIVARHDSQHTIQNLTSQVALLTTRYEGLQHSSAALTTRHAELERQHEDLKLSYDELEEDYENLERDCRDMRGQIEGRLFLKDDLPSRRRRLKDGSPNPLHLDNVRSLQSGGSGKAPAASAAGGSHLTEHLAAISKSGRLLASISADNTALTSQAITQQDSIFKLEARLAEQASEARRAERSWNAEYLALVEKAREAQEEHKAALAALQAQHAEEVKGYTAQRHLLEMDAQRLQSSLADLTRQLALLDRLKSSLQIDKQNLATQLEELQRRMDRSLWSWRLQQELHDYLRSKTDNRQKLAWDAEMDALRAEIARLQALAETVAKEHERELATARLLVSHPVASSLLVYLKTFPSAVAEKLTSGDLLGIKVLDLLREKLLAKIEHAAGVRARSDAISNEEKAASGFTEADASKTFINTRLLYTAEWSPLEMALLESWESLLFNQFQASEFSQEKIWLYLYKTCRKQIATIMRGAGAIAEEEETQGPSGSGAPAGKQEQPPPVKLGMFAPKGSSTCSSSSGTAAAASAINAASDSRKKSLLQSDAAAAVDRDADGLAELMALREASKATESIRLDLERLAAENAELRASLEQHQQAQLDAAADEPRQAELTRDREEQISALEEHVRALERALAVRQPSVQTSMRELELLRLTRSKLTMGTGSSTDHATAASDVAARQAADEASKASAAQIALLESSNLALVKENRSWARKFEESRGRANKLQEELDALRASRPSAAVTIAAAAASAVQTQGTFAAALEADNAQLASDLSAKRGEASKLQDDLHNLQEQLQRTQRKLTDAEVYIAALTQAGGSSDSAATMASRPTAAAAAPATAMISVSSVPATAATAAAPSAAVAPSASFVAAAATAQREQEKLRRALADSESALRQSLERCATLESEVEVLRTTETALKQRVLDWKAQERAWKQERESLLASHELAVIEAAAAASNDALDSSTSSQSASAAAEAAHASALNRLQSQLTAAQSAQASLAAEVASLERDNAEWESKFTAVRRQMAEDKKKAAAALAAAVSAAASSAASAASAASTAPAASVPESATPVVPSAPAARARDSLLASLQSELDEARAELATEVNSALALRAKLAWAQEQNAQQSQEIQRLQQRIAELEMLLGARGQSQSPAQSQPVYGVTPLSSQVPSLQPSLPLSSSSRPSFAASVAGPEANSDQFASSTSTAPRFAATFQGSSATATHAPSNASQALQTTAPGMRVTHHHHVLAPSNSNVGPSLPPTSSFNSHATAGPLVPYSSSAAPCAAVVPASPDSHRRHVERKRLADLYEEALRNGEIVDVDAMARTHVASSPERIKGPPAASRSRSPAASAAPLAPGLAAIDDAFASAHAAIEADQKSHAAMERAWEAKRAAMQAKMHRKQSAAATAAAGPSKAGATAARPRVASPPLFDEKDNDSDALFGPWPPKFQSFSVAHASSAAAATRGSASGAGGGALVRAPPSESITSSNGESLPFPYFPRGPLMAPSLPVSRDAQRFSIKHAEEIGAGVRGAAAADGSSTAAAKGRTGADRERERRAIDTALGVRGITPSQVAALAREASLQSHRESIAVGVAPAGASPSEIREQAAALGRQRAADDARIGVRDGEAPGAVAMARLATASARRAEDRRVVGELSPSRGHASTKHKPFAALPQSIIRATGSPAKQQGGTPSKRAASAHSARRVR